MAVIVSSHGFEYGVKHFYSLEFGLVADIITSALKIDDGTLNELFKLGCIYINNERLTDFQRLHSEIPNGQLIRVHTKPRRYRTDYDWTSKIVYNHNDFIILNKPSGIPSHPSVDNIIENSLTQMEKELKIPLFISHRLDTTTEGLIVYGKNKNFVSDFNNELQNKNTTKKYVALIPSQNNLPEKIIHYMEPTSRAPKNVSAIYNEKWYECELIVELQKKYNPPAEFISTTNSDYSESFDLLKLNLITGRTHQIRAQLSALGAPLIGDILYGSKIKWTKNKKTDVQTALKACFISFQYKNQLYEFELPENFDY